MAAWDELVLACAFKPGIPQQVIETLQFMMSESTNGLFDAPKHPFFTEGNSYFIDGQYASNWRLFFQQDTTYFSGKQQVSLDRIGDEQFALTLRVHIRKGTDVIREFLDWLAPYIDEHEDFLGYTVCDESTKHVELIYLEDGDIYYYSAQLWNNPPDIKKTKITNNHSTQNT